MIERKIVSQKLKEYQISEYISDNLRNSGHSHTKVQRTPLGEKILIYTSRPGLIVGKKGQNIKKLTQTLKKKFNLENPQIEIAEIEIPDMDAQIVAEKIAMSLERFGIARFKGIVHKALQDTMNVGARGIEIVIAGKVPSSRATSWRFYKGYLKKCGDIALTGVHKAYASARLKSGVCGVQVKIMPPTTVLPDNVQIKESEDSSIENSNAVHKEEAAEKKKPRRRPSKKKEALKDDKEEPKEAMQQHTEAQPEEAKEKTESTENKEEA